MPDDDKTNRHHYPECQPLTGDINEDSVSFIEVMQRDDAGRTLFNMILVPMYPGGIKAFTN